MKALIQRVSTASVSVDERCVGKIGFGLLLFLGVERDDNERSLQKLADKVLAYRLFEDEQGKMNNSLLEVKGELLVVSQFTLVANTQKGLRPSFSEGADPELGERLYGDFVSYLRESPVRISTGCYGADMKVSLVNDGPVTFMLEV